MAGRTRVVDKGSRRGRFACVLIFGLITSFLLSCASGCRPAKVELEDLVGDEVRVVIRTETRHKPSDHIVDVMIQSIDIENDTVTLVEEGFPYPVPLSSIVHIERDGAVVFSRIEVE